PSDPPSPAANNQGFRRKAVRAPLRVAAKRFGGRVQLARISDTVKRSTGAALRHRQLAGVPTMTTILPRPLVLSLGLLACGFWPAPLLAQTAGEAAKAPQTRVEELQRLLDQTMIETAPFQEAMPLGRLLQSLQKYLPKEEKLSLRIDTAAFGERL